MTATDLAFCPSCSGDLSLFHESKAFLYCPFCSIYLPPYLLSTRSLSSEEKKSLEEAIISFMTPLSPAGEVTEATIPINAGAMGLIYLIEDKNLNRKIIYKKMAQKSRIATQKKLLEYFINEVTHSFMLNHPFIIPALDKNKEREEPYYTMPFIEGNTISSIIIQTNQQYRNRQPLNPIGSSIPKLTHLFHSICQTLSYAHSKNLVHRDLHLNNVLIGECGEIKVLDWGLSRTISSEKAEEKKSGAFTPEQVDIFKVGRNFFIMLTCRNRSTYSGTSFGTSGEKGPFSNPHLNAPHRNISPILSYIVNKATSLNPMIRYKEVEEMIQDLRCAMTDQHMWITGRSILKTDQKYWNRSTFSFSSNTQYSLYSSSSPLSKSIQVSTKFKLSKSATGIGFLLNVLFGDHTQTFSKGYHLWLSSNPEKASTLSLHGKPIFILKNLSIQNNRWTKISIENNEKDFKLILEGETKIEYRNNFPFEGSSIAFYSDDATFEMTAINLAFSSLEPKTHLLSIPETFLAIKDYPQALERYKQIESRTVNKFENYQASFQIGMTYLMMAIDGKIDQFTKALKKFNSLITPLSAPIGLLGQSILFQTKKEFNKELECYQIAYSEYPHNPFLYLIEERIHYRLQQCPSLFYDELLPIAELTLQHLNRMKNKKEMEKSAQSLIGSTQKF